MSKSKTLAKHTLTCFSCQEDFIVLLDSVSESDPNHCPFCGSTEIGAYGSKAPQTEEEVE